MRCHLSSLAIAAAIIVVIYPVVAQAEQNTAVFEKTVDATSFSEIVRSAVGPFETYCDGYGNPGANGTGYVSVITLHVSKVPKTMMLAGQKGEGLDGTVAFDKAESSEAYIGQINLIVASSFSGLNGVIWGYDIAKADELTRSPIVPLLPCNTVWLKPPSIPWSRSLMREKDSSEPARKSDSPCFPVPISSPPIRKSSLPAPRRHGAE